MQSTLLGTPLVDKAMQVAIIAHNGQFNKHDGEPYILHPMRVFIATRNGGLDEEHQATAWLHDTIEDTWVTADYLFAHGFGVNVIEAVMSLTKRKGDTNEEYYRRLHGISRRVKIHDINENFGRTHMITDPATRERMTKKYSLGLDILCRTHL